MTVCLAESRFLSHFQSPLSLNRTGSPLGLQDKSMFGEYWQAAEKDRIETEALLAQTDEEVTIFILRRITVPRQANTHQLWFLSVRVSVVFGPFGVMSAPYPRLSRQDDNDLDEMEELIDEINASIVSEPHLKSALEAE
eukprot:SAG11_NODE_20434_length_445_cov_0.881503_1_plen_138_part_01